MSTKSEHKDRNPCFQKSVLQDLLEDHSLIRAMEKVTWERAKAHELNFAKEIASDTPKDRLKVTERGPEGPEVSHALSGL